MVGVRKMQMITSPCLGILCLFAGSGAVAQAPRSDADILNAEVMPALSLVADPRFSAIIKPYANCFSMNVATSSASLLQDDQAVQSAEQLAALACSTIKQTTTKKAEEALIIRFPSLSAEERAALLRRVRRQATFFALVSEYQRVGKLAVFQRYLERIGRESRNGHLTAMLSGE